LAAGNPPARCYLDLLVGAIDDISGRSRLPDAPVAEEYLATATAARLVARLGARFRRPGRSRGTVVFGAPKGEHHTLAISVVADLVRLEGFECLELGADVPPEAFAGAARSAHRLIAVGVGAATAKNLGSVRATVRAVHDVDVTIPVVVGGQAANPASGLRTGADAWAADGCQAVKIFGDLAKSRRRLWLVEDSDAASSGTASAR
jgi:methanogenic corrinoid protein MtbC1